MTLEFWNTFFAAATFVVIAATAVAAIIQLRHLRSTNQMNALLTMMQMWESPGMQEHYHYLISEFPKRLEDPAFRASAAWAMGMLGDPIFLATAQRLRDDQDPKVRHLALRCLARLRRRSSPVDSDEGE